MAKIVEARVRQKTATLQEWMDSTIRLLDGEQAFIRSDVDDVVIGFKLGADNKLFSELPYPDFSVRDKVNPASSWDGKQSGVYIPIENGTYNGVTVDLSDGYQVLYWDGTTLNKVVYDRIVDVVNSLTSNSEIAALSANQGRILNELKEDKSNKVSSITPSNTQYPNNNAIISYFESLFTNVERTTNKAQSIDSSTVKYPSNRAVQTYIQNLLSTFGTSEFGGVIDGSYDLSSINTPSWFFAVPDTYNIPTLGTVELTSPLSIITRSKKGIWSYEAVPLDMPRDFLVYETMQDMRNMSDIDKTSLVNGTVKGALLLGYYEKEDTSSPIYYYLSSSSKTDDGGSVIEIGNVKLEHEFVSDIDPRYFGCILDGVTDNNIQFKKTLAYAKNKGFITIKDGNLFVDIGNDPNKVIFIDDNTKIRTDGSGSIIVNNLFVPAFVAALSKNWFFNCRIIYRAQYDSSVYGYVNGVSGETFGELFDRTVYKKYLEDNRGLVFTGNYNPRKLIYASYLSVLLLRGAVNFDIDNLSMTSEGETPDKFIRYTIKWVPERPRDTVIDASTANIFQHCEKPYYKNIYLDRFIMGLQGGAKKGTVGWIRAYRFSDVQNLDGSFVGGYDYNGDGSYWMPPPHTLYINDEVEDFTIEGVDDSQAINVGITKARPTPSGSMTSVKLKCTNLKIGTIISKRADGVLDLIQGSKNISIDSIDATFDSSIFPAGNTFAAIRCPSEGVDGGSVDQSYLDGITIGRCKLTDLNPNPNIFPISRATKVNNMVINNLDIYLKDFSGNICGVSLNGNNNYINYNLYIENHTQTASQVQQLATSSENSNIPIGRESSKGNTYNINVYGWRQFNTNNYNDYRGRILLSAPSNLNTNKLKIQDFSNNFTTEQNGCLKTETWLRSEIFDAPTGTNFFVFSINIPSGWTILESSFIRLTAFGSSAGATSMRLGSNTNGNQYMDEIPLTAGNNSFTFKNFQNTDVASTSNRAIRVTSNGGNFDGTGRGRVLFKIQRTIQGE